MIYTDNRQSPRAKIGGIIDSDFSSQLFRLESITACYGKVMFLQGCARFTENLSELTKTWSSGATECGV